MSTILEGLTVLELCEVYQGPLAGQCLGDFGARVIKIERGPLGDPLRAGDFHAAEKGLMSSYFAAANRNKESICLDLKTAAGREALCLLVDRADVLLHNYRPGVMEKLGLGYEDLSKRNPRLIYACASGFGESGPWAQAPGQDILIQSVSGIAARPEGKPQYVNAPLSDYASGMVLVQGVLLALLERGKSGLGQKVSVSLFDTAVSIQSLEAAAELNYGLETRWIDRALNFPIEGSDGWLTVLGFFRDNPLQLICQALGIEDLSVEMGFPGANEQRLNRDAIVEKLAPEFRKHTVDELVQRLQRVGVLCAPVLPFAKTLHWPQLRSNGMVRTVPAEGQADMQVIDHPLRLSRTPHTVRKGPPHLGENTVAVLAELGWDAERAKAAAGLTS